MPPVSHFNKARIVTLVQMVLSYKHISSIFGIPKSTINSIMEKLRQTERLERRQGSGGRRVSTPNEKDVLVNIVQDSPFTTAVDAVLKLCSILKSSQKNITEQHLLDPLEVHRSKQLGDKLEKLWQDQENFKKSPSLIRALFRLVGPHLLVTAVLVLTMELASLILQPYFLQKLLKYYQHNQTTITVDQAYFNGAMITLVAFLRTLIFHHTSKSLKFVGIKLRIACSSLIYRKSLKVKHGRANVGHLVNLLSNDVNRLETCFIQFHYIWVGPLCMVLGVGFLGFTEGVMAASGAVVIVLFIFLQGFLTKKSAVCRRNVAVTTDHRVGLLHDIVTGIQVIKFYAWEKAYVKLVEAARRDEVQKISTANNLRLGNMSIRNYVSKLCVFATLLAATIAGVPTVPGEAFIVFQVYEAIKMTSVVAFQFGAMGLTEAMVSVHRIQEFLLHDQHPVKTDDKINVVTKHVKVFKKSVEVRLEDVSVKWSLESSICCLTGVDFIATKGDLVGIVGRAGSGKSTLLHTILQEVNIVKGHVKVNGGLSFATQEPWIFTGNIKDNILFGSQFDQKKYSTVIRICALEKDLSVFPDGDQTRVGERGVMLSGGQKSRIGLARAVYKDADIYVLDDPLSAVDTQVAQTIFRECITGYLKDKCVILVTHQIQFLNNINHIYVVESGKVKKVDHKNTPLPHFETTSEHFTLKECSTMSPQLKELTQKKCSKRKCYKSYSKAAGHLLTVAIFILFLSITVSSVFVDYVMSFYTHIMSSNMDDCIYIYTFLVLFLILLSHLVSFLTSLFCGRASKNMHNKMLHQIMGAPISFFNHHSSGRILNRFSKDMGIIDELFPLTLMNVIASIFTIIGGMCMIIFSNYWMIIPVVIVFGAVATFIKVFQQNNQNIKRIEASTKSFVYTHLSASIEGLTTIRAFGVQDKMAEMFDIHQDLHTSALYLFTTTFIAFAFWIELVCNFFNSVVIFGFFVLQNVPSIGNIGLAITQSISILSYVQYVSKRWSELESQLVSVERVVEYTELDQEPDDANFVVSPTWPENGEVSFESVTLRYSPEASPVLKNLNFTIRSGEKVGIVGRTGAGKSSIISVLFRLFDFNGSVNIDGIDSTTISLHSLRPKISIIPQEPILFLGTLRKNIDPFREFSDDQIWQCLDEVELKETIANLPAGLESMVSERGSNFSVGQKQLLCLVRAMLKNNKIIVLDEATANVDLQTDALIQTTVRKKFRDCTVLTIAHRLNTVIDSDRILVMDDGCLVEFDSPQKLLQNCNSFLYRFLKVT